MNNYSALQTGRMPPTSLQQRAQAKIELNKRQRVAAHQPPTNWRDWLTTLFPRYVTEDFADRHREFWRWVWTIDKERPQPFIMLWPRKGGKSTNAELALVRFGAESLRAYAWYCCETQDQADKHLETISLMIENSQIGDYYPGIASPKVNKHGNFRGWRRNRLWTESGFIVDAIGLDTARRGAKVAEHRPGLMVFDDLDGEQDPATATEKKINTLTKSLLPAGSNNLAVIFAQNLIHIDSIASRLADDRAEFLADRIVSGPFKAIEGLTYEQRLDEANNRQRYYITGGTATWSGQSVPMCQKYIDTEGLTSFKSECQQDVAIRLGGMYNHIEFRHCTWSEIPELVDGCVWIDPAVTATDNSDSMGIQADGLGIDDIIYRLWSWEDVTSPNDALKRAILKAIELKFDRVGVETDQGGDLWMDAFYKVADGLFDDPDYPHITEGTMMPDFVGDKAGAGHGSKVHRQHLVLADYERGGIIHATGTHELLETALYRFPKFKPFDLADAGYWSWNDLRNEGVATGSAKVGVR